MEEGDRVTLVCLPFERYSSHKTLLKKDNAWVCPFMAKLAKPTLHIIHLVNHEQTQILFGLIWR